MKGFSKAAHLEGEECELTDCTDWRASSLDDKKAKSENFILVSGSILSIDSSFTNEFTTVQ